MQKYPDSGPAMREGFQVSKAPAPGATIGDLLRGEWYKNQYNALKAQELKEYTDATFQPPLADWFFEDPNFKISTFVFITHVVLGAIAIYFSIRATCGFDAKNFFAALFCPYIYLPYYLSLYGLAKVCSSNLNLKRNAAALAEAD
jgi:hypothetical protein